MSPKLANQIGEALDPLVKATAAKHRITPGAAWERVSASWGVFSHSPDSKYGPGQFARSPRQYVAQPSKYATLGAGTGEPSPRTYVEWVDSKGTWNEVREWAKTSGKTPIEWAKEQGAPHGTVGYLKLS